MRMFSVLFAAIVGFMCAPIGDLAAAPQGKRIAHLTGPTRLAFLGTVEKGLTDRGKELGMQVTTWVSPFDPALQSQQIDDAIAQKFDMIALLPVSENAIVPALTRAKAAGIPVIVINSPVRPGSEDLYLSYIGEDHTQLGRVAGIAVLDALKKSGRDGGKVAVIAGSLNEGVGPRRVAGFKEIIAKNPKVEIVAIEDSKWDTEVSERIAGQLYARFAARGGLDAIYGMADNIALGAMRAAEAAHIPLGIGRKDLIVVGGNCMKPGIDAIKAGKQYATATQIPIRTGRGAAELIADYFNGKTLPKNMFLPAELVNKDNLAKWGALCSY